MAKRVLGNDPFANGKEDESAPKTEAGRSSKRPAPESQGKSKPSTNAKHMPSKAVPSARPPQSAKPAPNVKHVEPAKPMARPTAKSSAPVAKKPRPERLHEDVERPDLHEEPGTTEVVEPDSSDEITRVAMAVAATEITAAQGERDENAPAAVAQKPDTQPAPPEPEETASSATPEDVRAEPIPPPAIARTPDANEVKDDIRTIEAEIDRLLGQVAERGADREALDRMAARLRETIESSDTATQPESPPEQRMSEPPTDPSVFDVARELLSSDYYRRQWGRVAMRDRAEEVDDFGLDPKFTARVRPFFDFLYSRWWRIETHDIDRVPAEGRVILCANHSGAIPYDGAMLATALRREHPARRELRWLAEDFIFHFPFLGVFMNRIGAVRACQENAERLLRKSACVGVFPEGVKGISKPFRDRYRLQRFGRGGHVKLAIRTRTPIVPVAILGAEEAHPLLAPTSILAKALGVPFVPITPTFPLLGPLGLVPVPSKWKIFFLDPIPMDGYAPDAADDEVLVGRLNEKIRGLIQEELDRAVRERQSVFRG